LLKINVKLINNSVACFSAVHLSHKIGTNAPSLEVMAAVLQATWRSPPDVERSCGYIERHTTMDGPPGLAVGLGAYTPHRKNLNMVRNISIHTASSKSSQYFILKMNTNICAFLFSFAGLGT
jgi:hypothetical protein